MTRFTKLTTLAVAVAIIAATAQAPTSEASAGTPIDHMVDCSDSFWTITCFGISDPAPETPVVGPIRSSADLTPEAPPLGLIRIDNDPICVEIGGGSIVCHT